MLNEPRNSDHSFMVSGTYTSGLIPDTILEEKPESMEVADIFDKFFLIFGSIFLAAMFTFIFVSGVLIETGHTWNDVYNLLRDQYGNLENFLEYVQYLVMES